MLALMDNAGTFSPIVYRAFAFDIPTSVCEVVVIRGCNNISNAVGPDLARAVAEASLLANGGPRYVLQRYADGGG